MCFHYIILYFFIILYYITDADNADDIALQANTSAQAETLLHSLKRAAAVTGGIGLHVNAHKTEYMCFNQRVDISTLNGSSLKLVGKFNYLGSSVSSTETDINTWLAKAWTAIDRSQTVTTQECCEQYWTSPGGSTTQNSSCTATYHLSRKPSKLDEPHMQDTAGEVRANS